jgi:hypothetical protein
MTALVPARTDALALLNDRLTDDEIDAALDYAEASRAASTLRAYAMDWREFVACAPSAGRAPCPVPLACCAATSPPWPHPGHDHRV